MSDITYAIDSDAYRAALAEVTKAANSVETASRKVIRALVAVFTLASAADAKSVDADLRRAGAVSGGSWRVWRAQARLIAAAGFENEVSAAVIQDSRRIIDGKRQDALKAALSAGFTGREAFSAALLPGETAETPETPETPERPTPEIAPEIDAVPDTAPVPEQRTASVTVSEVSRSKHAADAFGRALAALQDLADTPGISAGDILSASLAIRATLDSAHDILESMEADANARLAA